MAIAPPVWGLGVVVSGKELRDHFILLKTVIPCTECAVSITILGDTLVDILIFIVEKNQINPLSLLPVWKCLRQPVQRTEYENSKKPQNAYLTL